MKINWKIAIALSIFALIRPVMSIIGVTEFIGQPYASLTLTLLISIVWIVTIIYKDIETPIYHLVVTGILYALFAIVLSAVLSPILLGQLMGPLTHPFAIFSVFMTNIVWGGITGIITWGIMKTLKNLGD